MSEPSSETRAMPVDLEHLSRQTMGDDELAQELLEMFAAATDAYLAPLKAGGSAQEIGRAAHRLKGAARGIGAWRLAELAGQAENAELADIDAIETEADAVREFARRFGKADRVSNSAN